MANEPLMRNETASTPSQGTEMNRSLHRSAGSFELAFAPVIMALIGLWIDRTLGTVPLFTITLALVGVVGAGIKAYYSYGHSMEQLAQDGSAAAARPDSQYHARRRTDAVESARAAQEEAS